MMHEPHLQLESVAEFIQPIESNQLVAVLELTQLSGLGERHLLESILERVFHFVHADDARERDATRSIMRFQTVQHRSTIEWMMLRVIVSFLGVSESGELERSPSVALVVRWTMVLSLLYPERMTRGGSTFAPLNRLLRASASTDAHTARQWFEDLVLMLQILSVSEDGCQYSRQFMLMLFLHDRV